MVDWEWIKFRLSLAVVDVFDWLGERCNWVSRKEHRQVVDAYLGMMYKLFAAEQEIVRLRKKCGEDWKKEYPHLL